MPVIEVQELTKRFGPVLAVDQLSFSVEQGTVTGFLGPNGAGKTTTLRMLLGLVEPTHGQATVNGRRYRELADPLRHVGAVLEASSFHPGRTARDHLRVQAAAAGISPRRVDEVLEQVGLAGAAGRRVAGFSLGMRQRLGLAAGLLGEPEVLILDEPANGLDPEGIRWLRGLIRSHAAAGGTVLVSSHLLAEVAQTVDLVLIVDHGHLAAQRKLGEPGHAAILVRTPGAQRLCRALAADGAQVTADGAGLLEVSGSTPERIGELASKLGVPITESRAVTQTLEEMFLHLTGPGSAQPEPR